MRLIKKSSAFISKHSFLRDVSYTIGGQILVMALGLLINKLISNYLRPADFAIFSIANRTASVLAFVMLMGLGIAVPRYIASARAKKDEVGERALFYSACLLMIAASVAVFAIVIFGSDEFAKIIFGDKKYVGLVLPTLFFSFGIALSSFVYSYFRGVDKFKQYNILQVVSQAISLIIVIVSGTNIVAQLASRGLVIGLLSVVVLGYIVTVIYKKVPVSPKKIKENCRDLLGYCLPRVPGEAFLFAYPVVPLIIINTRFDLHTAAAFATAITLNAIVVPLFQFVGMVLLPYVSKNLVHGKISDIHSKITKLRYLYLGVSIMAVLFMLCFADIVISLLFSDEYVQFAPIVKLVFLSVIPYSLYLLLRNPLDAISKIPFNTVSLGVGFGLLVLIVLLSPNPYVSAAAFPVSYLVLGVLSEIIWAWQFKKSKNKKTDVEVDNSSME